VGLAVGASAIILALAFGGGPSGSGVDQAYAGAAIEVAEANPRVLIDAPGWTVEDVDEFEESSGTMAFVNGDQRLNLDWNEVPEEWMVTDDELLSDLPRRGQWFVVHSKTCVTGEGAASCAVYLRDTEVPVLGEPAVLAEVRTITGNESSSRFEVRLPVADGIFTTIYAENLTRAEIDELLPSLVRAEVETWLAALPPSTVQPLERPEIVDEMLRDVPIPASVDVDELKSQAIAAGRYHLGAQVTGAVACGWLDQWAAALEAGDEAALREATEAMSTSPDWDILIEMNEQGGWSQVVWEDSREMRGDEPRNDLLDSGGTESFHGITYELGPSYAMGLGCDSLTRTVREDTQNYAQPPEYTPVDAPPA